MAGVQELELEGVIGFSGVQRHALLLHPNDAHIIYPLGATVVIRNVHDNKDQTFLQGHTDRVTCITMSKDGKLLASGQITHMGYLAQIMVWDISQIGTGQPKLMHVLKLHKVQIQALAFSCHGSYLASLGGADDNNLVIWRVEDGMAICGSPASHDSALTLCWYNNSEGSLASGGLRNLRVWDFDAVNRKVRPTDVALGQNNPNPNPNPNPHPNPNPNPNPNQVRPTDVALGQNKRSINCKLLAWLGSQGCRGTGPGAPVG